MGTFKSFVLKEFWHILRDRKTLLVLLGMPVVQIILFGFALTNEVKNTEIYVVNMAGDEMSASLIAQIDASKYFQVAGIITQSNRADDLLKTGKARLVMVIPAGFGQQLRHQKEVTLQLLTDGSNPNLAATINSYLSIIVRDFRNRALGELQLPMTLNVEPRMLYNPQLKGEYTFVPGVIAMVLMIICVMMTSVSIVKEKELGNMELLLVSPTRPHTIILAKAIPYFLLSLVLVTIILLMSRFLLGIPIRGNLFLLYGVSALFIITALSLGMVISTITNSQQVAMLISLMGMMLPTIMFGGFMFPIENMPLPMQVISNIIPAKWFYYAINDIMIKGQGFGAVYTEVVIMAGFTLLFLAISYKKFNMRLG